jgi:hypothetical protein
MFTIIISNFTTNHERRKPEIYKLLHNYVINIHSGGV